MQETQLAEVLRSAAWPLVFLPKALLSWSKLPPRKSGTATRQYGGGSLCGRCPTSVVLGGSQSQRYVSHWRTSLFELLIKNGIPIARVDVYMGCNWLAAFSISK